MKRSLFPAVLLSLIPAAASLAGDAPGKEVQPPATSPWSFSYETSAGWSYAATARLDGKNVSEQAANAQAVMTAQHRDGPPIRLGVSWQRFSFGGMAGSRTPNTLQSAAIVAGLDFQFGDSILMRLESQPGFYSGNAEFVDGSFDIPIVLGGAYIVNKDLQIMLGVRFDPQSKRPIMGGGGFRWQVSDRLVANMVFPKPRLEYRVSETLNLYGGAELLGGSYRVDSDHGNRTGEKKLNHAWLDYTEVRLGAGATMKLGSSELKFELGYQAYRDVDFHRAEVGFDNDGHGSIYGGLSLKSKF